MAVKIPENQKKSLTELIEMPDKMIEELQTAFESARPSLSIKALTESLKDSVSLPHEQVSSILSLLFTLGMAREYLSLSVDRFSSDVSQAAANEHLGALEPGSPKVKQLKNRLARLLSIDHPLGLSAKAVVVSTRTKDVFHSADILTDLRPVFSSEEPPEPRAAIIIHNLAILSHPNDRDAAHYFALDRNDLISMRKLIERALKKDASLRKMAKKADLAMLDNAGDYEDA